MKLRTVARRCLILTLGLGLWSPRAVRAADVNGAWANLTITGSALANRAQHGAIDDPLADRMVVFGGAENLADTWSLSLGGPNSWTNLNPTNPPTGRKAMSVVYDPVRNRMIMFGGYDGDYRNDVWTLSLSGAPTWTRMLPGGLAPSGRMFSLAVYDPLRDRLIVFGGHPEALNDVWALSLSGTPQWSQILPTGTLPSPRYGHMGIYDPVGDRLVVFGGTGGPDETWALNLSGVPQWTQLAVVGPRPPARFYGSAVYDSRRGRMVIHGGFDGTQGLNDTWALDLAGDPVWSQLVTTGQNMPARWLHTAVYQSSQDRMAVFGGASGGSEVAVLTWGSASSAPLISSFSPGGGRIGDPVQVFGSSFTNATQVAFHGVAAPLVQVSFSRIVTNVPVGATTGPITVTTPDGTATSAVSFFVGQTPEVLSATPMQSKIGGTVVIQGHHFNGATRVAFGPSSNASFTVDSDDQITAVVDRNAVTGKITVVTPAAAGTSAFDFTVLPFDNFARIASILDVPHDQGGQVTLRWLRSDFDDPTDHLISGYRVWRRAPLEGVSAAAAHPTWRHEVTASGEIVYWEPMTLVPAAFLDGYAYVSPTTQDSTEDGNPFTAFFIQTLTSDPTVFYNSPVDSGYSVDNEPPHKPPKFKAQGVNHKYKLDWGGNVERDFFAYRLHRGATMTFTPDSLNTVYFGADTGWVDTLGAGSYYKLAAVDRHGNVSKYALVTPSGSTTSVAFTVSSQVGPEHVTIDWYVIGLSGVDVTIYRRDEGEPWQRVSTAVTDAVGIVHYRDENVRPGQRLGYRLGALDADGAEEFSDETWVSVPEDRLALLGVWPNPAGPGASLVVRLLLPRGSAAASLRLLDVAGRTLIERQLRDVSPGAHEERLAREGRLEAGVYWVQVRQNGKTVAAKVTLLE